MVGSRVAGWVAGWVGGWAAGRVSVPDATPVASWARQGLDIGVPGRGRALDEQVGTQVHAWFDESPVHRAHSRGGSPPPVRQ